MAKKLVPKCLDAVSIDNIRRYFNLTWRYLDAYRFVLYLAHTSRIMSLTNNSQGLSIKQAEFTVKKYKSHRHIPARVMMDLEIMNL